MRSTIETFVILILLCEEISFKIYADAREDSNILKLLWWTPFIENSTITRTCGTFQCTITDNRNELHLTTSDGILFYGSDFNPLDLPLPRPKDQWWALLHEESPKNQPLICHNPVISLFNFTSTISSNSDMPLTLQYLKNTAELTNLDQYVNTDKKNKYISNGKAAVIYLQSQCDTPSSRDEYVKQLSNYVKVSNIEYSAIVYSHCMRFHTWDTAHGYEGMLYGQIRSIF